MSIAEPFFYIQDTLLPDGSVTDQSQHARTVIVSGVNEVQNADFGSCLQFSNNSYLQTNCSLPASFTLAFWVRRVYEEEGTTRSLVEWGPGQARLCLNDLRPSFQEQFVAPNKLARAMWQHVALSFDAKTQTSVMYINGARVGTASGPVESSNGALRIGRGNAADPGFEGQIAHFVIYDRPLSDDDLRQVMWATEKVLEPVLLLRDTARLIKGSVKDDSGDANPCKAEGVLGVVDVDRGPCFKFGDGYLSADALLCPDAFTLSVWVKRDASAQGSFYPLFGFGQDAPGLAIQNGKLGLVGGVECPTNFPADEWKHVAITYNPLTTTSILYVDGNAVARATTAIDTSGPGLLIGMGWREEDPRFPGLMTQITVHDSPLSPKDIRTLYDFSAIRPRLHLPLEMNDATGRTPDRSGYDVIAMCDGAIAASDDTFGTAFQFDGVNDHIHVPTFTCPTSFTLAAHILPTATSCAQQVPLLEFGQGDPFFWLSYGKIKVPGGPIVDNDSILTAGVWRHVAATYDASTTVLTLYIDGEVVASGPFSGTTGGTGLGIGHFFSASWFGGRMRHVLVYDRVLPQSSLRHLVATTSIQRVKTAAPLTRPAVGLFSMDLVNDDDQPVLYLEGSQQLSLSVENTWSGDIRLGAVETPVGPDSFHFQLRFRQGTLLPSFRDELITGKSVAVRALAEIGWQLHCKNLDTGGDQISLLWTGVSSNQSVPLPQGGILKAGARLLLPLQGVQAKIGAGSRSSRVLMRYANMLLPDNSPVIPGQRIELLNILARPRDAAGTVGHVVTSLLQQQLTIDAKLPVEIKLRGDASILNDGGTNTLQITIRNIRRRDEQATQLDLGFGGAQDSSPKFYIALPALFDDTNGSSNDNINGVIADIHSSSSSPTHGWTCSKIGNRWCIEPPASEKFFEPNELITFTLSNLVTNEHHGIIYLDVRYEDIAGFGEGEFHIPVPVAPMSFSRINGRDTVVIRHGNQVGADPGNEALFVETSEGLAARFRGGGGVFIDTPHEDSPALTITTSSQSNVAALALTKTGRHYGLSVDATSTDAAIFVDQDGKGEGIRIYKQDPNDTNPTGTPALDIVHTGKSPAVYVDNRGISTAINVKTRTSNPALLIDQGANGNAAEFLGGGGILIDRPTSDAHGVHIKTTTSNTTASLLVDQKGTGLAAEFLGGGGVSIKTTSTALAIASSSAASSLVVKQNGSGPSANFSGGSGVTIDKLGANSATVDALTANTVRATDAITADKAVDVSGMLSAKGGFSVKSGTTVSGIPIIAFQSCSLTNTQSGSPDSTSTTVTFAQSVSTAEVMLQSFDIQFRKADDTEIEEHAFARMLIRPSCSVSGNIVTVSVTAGMRDNTKDATAWDDKYKWTVNILVIAQLNVAT